MLSGTVGHYAKKWDCPAKSGTVGRYAGMIGRCEKVAGTMEEVAIDNAYYLYSVNYAVAT